MRVIIFSQGRNTAEEWRRFSRRQQREAGSKGKKGEALKPCLQEKLS